MRNTPNPGRGDSRLPGLSGNVFAGRRDYEVAGGATPFRGAGPEPPWASAGCRRGAGPSEAPRPAAARGAGAAAPRLPGERRAPGTPGAEGRLQDCGEQHTLKTVETAPSPISGPQVFKMKHKRRLEL